MKLHAWGLSDVGQKRDHNEDSFLVLPDKGLFAVADGMGGHQGGERASRLAVEIMERELQEEGEDGPSLGGPGVESPTAKRLRSAARTAGRTIFDLAATDSDLLGMGTTLTALLFHGGRAYLAHVGDSRGYLYRDDNIEQLTDDHSWIEEQVRAGLITRAEAEASALKHVITRSVGFEREVDVDLVILPFLMGDCFLLCSDGLSNYLEAQDLREILRESYYANVPQRLVDEANARGGDDNITALLVYVANEAVGETVCRDVASRGGAAMDDSFLRTGEEPTQPGVQVVRAGGNGVNKGSS